MKKSVAIFLTFSLLFTAIPYFNSVSSENSDFIFPEYIPKDETPFLIKVKQISSEFDRVKAEIIAENDSASKLWNGNKWIYSRDSWEKMIKIENDGNFIYMKLSKDYNGFENLKNKDKAELRITYKDMETEGTFVLSTEVKLLDVENTENGTKGIFIDGYFNFYNESFMNEDKIVSIENDTSVLSIYSTENNNIDDYYKKVGYFKLAIPIGNYTLHFKEKNGNEIYLQNILAEKNQTIIIGNQNKSEEEKLLITEVYYDTYTPYELDEFIRVYNPTNQTIEISNFVLQNKNGKIRFPYSSFISPRKSIFITKSAKEFYSENLFLPEYEFNNSMNVRQMQEIDKGFSPSNNGDIIILKNFDGKIIDVVVYGNVSYDGEGWNGNPAKELTEGSVLKRNTKEFEFLNDFGKDDIINPFENPNFVFNSFNDNNANPNKSENSSENNSNQIENHNFIDTNTSSDFNSPRIHKIRQSNFKFTSFNFIGNITVFTSPDASFETIVNEIKNAKESIFINVYEFTNLHLMDEIINATKKGIKVKILLEGRPLPNLNDVERFIAEKLTENGSEVRFMINNETIKNRYQFSHAKYVVIDNKTLILVSENFKNNGIPINNTFGNRGWGIVIRDNKTAKYFSELFFTDFNPMQKDSFPFTKEHSIYGSPSNTFIPEYQILKGNYIPSFQSKTINGNFTVYPIVSPDTSAYLIQLLNSAKKYIYIEQMILNINWTEQHKNLFLNTVIKKAKEGIEVKIILDSSWVRENDTDDNKETVDYLNEVAENEKLNLQAKLIYLDGLHLLHNKGVIVDDKVLISSINWNYWAFTYNREVGIVIQNQETADYFKQIFIYDWNLKEENLTKDILPNETKVENSESSFPLYVLIGFAFIVFLSAIVRDVWNIWRKRK